MSELAEVGTEVGADGQLWAGYAHSTLLRTNRESRGDVDLIRLGQ
jgi:hypothetical protein